MDNEITIKELIAMDIDTAVTYKLSKDNCELAKSIYDKLFEFYCEDDFSGDVIFTWKSPSLVKDGVYIGKRDFKVENKIVIGNIFPNYKTNIKYSLNLNRNGNRGDFPHDYFDIYLDHIAKYAYEEDVPNIKEYYPLKRAILYNENMKYFKIFDSFDDFLKKYYLYEIWEKSKEKPFSDMEFDEYKKISSELMKTRGRLILSDLK